MPRLTAKEEARIAEIRESIAAFILDYFQQWQRPFPMHKLAGKYFKTLRYYGTSFPEQMDLLKREGRVQVTLTEKGAYEVTPPLLNWERVGIR